MKKLLPFLLAALLPLTAHAQRQSVTVDPNGLGAGTFNTAGISYYFMGPNTYDFNGSTILNAGVTVTATAVYQTVTQANSFVAGEPVAMNSSGVWVGASANSTLLAANAVGVVSSTGLSSSAFQVVTDGLCVVSGGSFTTGSIYYVPVAAGVVTSTAPSTAGQYVYPLATALSATVLSVSTSTPSVVVSVPTLSGNNTWTGTNQFNNRVEIGPNGTSATSYFSVDPAITVPGGVSSNMEQLTGVGTASGNSYATTGLLVQPNFTLGAYTGGNVNFVDIESGGSTTGTPASGYMLKVGAPLSGMTGAFDVVSGAVNLGSGTTTVGALSVTGTSALTGNVTMGAGGSASSNITLTVNGSTAAGFGAVINVQGNGQNYLQFGNQNAIIGGSTANAAFLSLNSQTFYTNNGTLALTLDGSQRGLWASAEADHLTTLTYASPTSVTVGTGNVFEVTTINATGSVTFNASGPGLAGQHMKIIIINDATSGKVITFGSNFRSTGTLTGTANKAATIEFVSDGTSWFEDCRSLLL